MSDQQTSAFSIRSLGSIAQISTEQWDQLTGSDYPFLRHAFLAALESTGCASAASGWQPMHLVLESTTEAGRLLGCMPLYLKNNSWGEYVFDWSWADAYQRHGLSYYPKLLTAIPFTPCAGPRLCLDTDLDPDKVLESVMTTLTDLATEHHASSWHLLFPDKPQLDLMSSAPLLKRSGCQYQWFNQHYQHFDDFLSTLNSRKRKNLRKERLKVSDQGISFSILEGAEVSEEQWHQFYRFYCNTYVVRGRSPYLSKAFFFELGRSMPDDLLLILAKKDEKNVAAALFFKGKETLYGRFWGSSDEFMFLHFETCYYQGIEYCIKHGYQRFDSGAQGEHKIQRGFQPVPTWSLHWIAQPDFSKAIAEFLRDENSYMDKYLHQAAEYLPFRKDLQLPSEN